MENKLREKEIGINIRVSQDEHEKLKKMAKEHNRSMNGQIKEMIKESK